MVDICYYYAELGLQNSRLSDMLNSYEDQTEVAYQETATTIALELELEI